MSISAKSVKGEYNASSIKVLSDEEAAEMFGYAEIEMLSEKYPRIAPEAIERLIKAADISGEEWKAVERRCLAGDHSIEVSMDFKTAYVELARNEGRGWRDEP